MRVCVARVGIVTALGCLLLCFTMYLTVASTPVVENASEASRCDDSFASVVEAKPFVEPTGYTFDEQADMQTPELPTGCEATTLATVLRMNGVEISKTEVADAMPKSDGEDFVHAFWGDPYSEHGMACMAPCVLEMARRFVPVEKTPVDLTGTQLVYLPTPCVVWVTMWLGDAMPSEYEQDGYGLLWNTHCVTLLAAGEATVKVIDPLSGLQEYPFSGFNKAYMANGCQAVYIADRGYTPLN